MTYAQVVNCLTNAAHPVRQLTSVGCVAVTPAAGRVIALAFSCEGENLLWSHPQLSETAQLKDQPEKLAGGIGGDRLWFAPEIDYHWHGPPDWERMSNYKIPDVSDPGTYSFISTDHSAIGLEMNGTLVTPDRKRSVQFHVRRVVRLAAPPLATTSPLMEGVDYVGIETSHTLEIRAAVGGGRIDLWHLLQVPARSVLVVPLKQHQGNSAAEPLSYARPGAWSVENDHIAWSYTGAANAKFGLGSAACIGRAGILRRLKSKRWCLIVRQFPVDSRAVYGDHPQGIIRSDQVFQAWDGGGFGELEYHSPLLQAGQGSQSLAEVDQLWAFGGPDVAIARLGRQLLGIEINKWLT